MNGSCKASGLKTGDYRESTADLLTRLKGLNCSEKEKFCQEMKLMKLLVKRVWYDSMSCDRSRCIQINFNTGPDSAELLVTSDEEKGDVGLNRCSKIAMIRNIDIKIAVATKPKEMAFMEDPKLFHGAS
ncbi:hypothetical protein SDJN02_23093, partial [Cucurbita argyrosperma subsp. argyrosperma]